MTFVLSALLALSPLVESAPAVPAPVVPAPAAAPAPSAPALVALQDVEEEPLHEWHGSIGVGLTWQGGNTRRTTFSGTAEAQYRREKDRTSANVLFNKSKEDGSTTDRKLYGGVKYDYFLSEKTYAYGKLSAEADETAFLDLRWILSVGIGRQFHDSAEFKLSGEVGLSYVDEDYDGNDDDAEYVAARLAYDWAYTPSERWELAQTGELFPSLEDSDDISSRLDTRGRLNLTETMFAQAQWIWTWDNTPASGAHHSDQTVLATLGWSF